MQRTRWIVCLGFLTALGFQISSAVVLADAGRPEYRFITIDIPTPKGQLGFTTLADINETGEISGGFTDTNVGPYGFILDKKMQPVQIRCGKDVIATVPQAINKHGEIAGSATVVIERIPIQDPPFEILITKTSGFYRNKRGRCTLLDFPSARLTEAVGINDDGQVVGDYQDTAGNFHGFFWDAGLFLTIAFPDATTTGPTAINNVGQIVGYYFDSDVSETFPNGHTHGFIYRNGRFSVFDFSNGLATFPTFPADINDSGHIVGIYSDADFISHSFLFRNDQFTDLNVGLPNTFTTEVSGINNKGQIVGRYTQNNPADPVNPFPSHGFVGLPKNHLKPAASALLN
jgi:probable HAF family extracellular repeat protein